MENVRPIVLIGTKDREELLENIKKKLQTLLTSQTIESEILDYNFFSDGAPDTNLENSVRGKHVYILSDVYSDGKSANTSIPSINDRYHESRLLQRTAHIFGAKTVNVIFPAFPYARDDKFEEVGTKPSMKRKPNAASMVVQDCCTNSLGYVLTQDIHNLATFSVPFVGGNIPKFLSLSYGWTIEEAIKRAGLDSHNTVLSGTDQGSTTKINAVCKDLHLPSLIAIKTRDYSQAQKVDNIKVFGDATDKDVVLYDDILDTGGTLITCLQEIRDKQPRSVNMLISHALFNKDSLEKLLEAHKKGLFNKLYITNSVWKEKVDQFFVDKYYPSFIEIIDVSTIFAHTISSIAQDKEINYNNNTPITH